MKTTVAAVTVAVSGWVVSASATSIFVEGRITAVANGGKTWTVKGYDHYNATKYGDKIGEVPVKVSNDGVFVLDNRVVKPAVALAVGRSAYCIGSSGGSAITLVLSEPASRQYGEVVSVAGNKVTLKVVMGKDAVEEEVILNAPATLTVGKTVRIAPARPATLLAYTPANVVTGVPAGFFALACGVLKDPAALKVATVTGEYAPEAVKKINRFVDLAGDAHGAYRLKTEPKAGQPAVVLCWLKRGSSQNWYAFANWPDAGLVEGVVKAAGKDSVTLSVLGVDGAKETTVKLDAGTVVKLDGKDSTVAEALKPGNHVSFFAKRAQTIEAAEFAAAAAH